MKKFLSFLILVIATLNIFSIGTDGRKAVLENGWIDKTGMQEDLCQVYSEIIDKHPDPFANISEGEFTEQYHICQKEIEEYGPENEFEFYRILKKLITKIGDGHLDLSFPGYVTSYMLQSEYFIPIRVKFISDEVFISDLISSENNLQAVGCRLVSINGIEAAEIIGSLCEIISSDSNGKWMKYFILERIFLYYYNLIYGGKSEFAVEYENADGEIYEIQIEGMSYREIVFEEKTNTAVDISELPELNAFMIKVESFSFYTPEELEEFENALEKYFKKIEESKYENLIIDLRGNMGGAPHASNALLRYLMPRKYVYFSDLVQGYGDLRDEIIPHEYTFRGNLHLIIDGGCFSSTGHFLSILKYHDVGIFIGKTSGGGFSCNDGRTEITLGYSLMRLALPTRTYATDVNVLKSDLLIEPDYIVETTPEDIKAKKDTVFDFVSELINKNGKM